MSDSILPQRLVLRSRKQMPETVKIYVKYIHIYTYIHTYIYIVPSNGIAVIYDFLLGSRSFAYECKLLFLKLNCLFCPFDAQKTSKQYANFKTSSS